MAALGQEWHHVTHFCIYTTTQKFFCSSRLHYLIKNIYRKTVILWNIITVWNNSFSAWIYLTCNLLLWCKAEFSALFLQSSVSHDPSEINLICWFTDSKLLKVNVCVCIYIYIIVFSAIPWNPSWLTSPTAATANPNPEPFLPFRTKLAFSRKDPFSFMKM